jgi:hypothetical protein
MTNFSDEGANVFVSKLFDNLDVAFTRYLTSSMSHFGKKGIRFRVYFGESTSSSNVFRPIP